MEIPSSEPNTEISVCCAKPSVTYAMTRAIRERAKTTKAKNPALFFIFSSQ